MLKVLYVVACRELERIKADNHSPREIKWYESEIAKAEAEVKRRQPDTYNQTLTEWTRVHA